MIRYDETKKAEYEAFYKALQKYLSTLFKEYLESFHLEEKEWQLEQLKRMREQLEAEIKGLREQIRDINREIREDAVVTAQKIDSLEERFGIQLPPEAKKDQEELLRILKDIGSTQEPEKDEDVAAFNAKQAEQIDQATALLERLQKHLAKDENLLQKADEAGTTLEQEMNDIKRRLRKMKEDSEPKRELQEKLNAKKEERSKLLDEQGKLEKEIEQHKELRQQVEAKPESKEILEHAEKVLSEDEKEDQKDYLVNKFKS